MKKILLFVLCIVFATTAITFAACGDSNDDGNSKENNKVTILYDFDEKGAASVRMNIAFGKITINENSIYVKSGKKSLKLSPSSATLDPFMYFPMESSILGFSKTNLNKIAEFDFDVYADKETMINVGMVFSNQGELKSAPTQFKLSEGWNSVSYKPDYSVIKIQYNLADFKGIYVGIAGKQENPPTLYIDNVGIIESNADIKQDNLIVLKQTSEYFEICDFEKAYQNLVFVSTGSGNITSLDVVNAVDYSIPEISGKKCLRVELHESSASGTSWTQIAMVPALVDAINFSQFDGQLDEYEFKFNVYREFEANFEANGQFDTLVEVNAYYNGKNAMDWSGITVTEKDVWMEFSAPLTTFSNFIKDTNISFYLAFMDKHAVGSYVYYFDNFRIEKIN